jgi:serine/threonine protein kinase/tetratricopeptide (TPR) repeat protein
VKGQSVGPYRVLQKIGAGGMGDVYLAEDDRLGRRVALKSPSEAWLEAPDARARLHREARAAARLNHPNIAGVYDVLESNGRPFIVMEHVEGESLAAVLSRGRVPLERALAIGVELSRALEAAHAAGIVHRDLKPGNVMITPAGRVKVLDFGLAKLADVDPEAGPLTHPGQVLGTPGYVAPEQLLGHRADARSDVYSAGAILYQLLSGRPPWGSLDERGRGLSAILAPVPNLATVDATLPQEVCDLVARAMEREPHDRFRSASDLRHALEHATAAVHDLTTVADGTPVTRKRRVSRSTAAIVCLLLLIALGTPIVWRWRTNTTAPSKASTLPVIAVLPLQNLSSDPKLEYVGAGFAETMSTKLATVNGLAVVSRSEIHDALNRKLDIAKLSRALGATYLVTGGVQQVASQIHVTINLLSADGGRIINGAIYDDSFENLFALQRRIAEQLTKQIIGTLSAATQQRLAREPTSNVRALAEYWRGRDYLDKPGPAPIEPAIAAFQESVRIDPSFALGYAGLGSAYWRKYAQTKDATWARRAIDTTEHAKQLDANDPDVGYTLASVYSGSGREDQAMAELFRVLDLQPSNDAAHRKLGEIYAKRSRIDAAVSEFNEAIRLRPDYWESHRAKGLVLWRAGRLAEAEQAFKKVIELQPDSAIGYQLLGNVHASAGELTSATRDFETAVARGGSFATYSSVAYIYYIQARFQDAVSAYQSAIAARPGNATTHWNLADALRHLGRDAEARREYQKAVDLFDIDLGVDPNDAGSLAVRATCQARLGRTANARADIDRATAIAADDPDVQYQRALVLSLSGRRDAALDALEKAVAVGYSRALLKVDQDLGTLRSSARFQVLLTGSEPPRRSR